MALEIRRLKTVYPCCNGRAILVALAAVPRETYSRTCPECRTRYLVERRAIPCKLGIIDVLDWTDTATRLYRRMYG